MKLVMDEKLKHRLIGLAVIISLAAIFAPAVMKKSSQNMDGNFSVNIKLPPKPVIPNVVTTDEQEMFKTIKVARVEIPPVSEKNQLPELAKAEPINQAQPDDKSTVALGKAAQDKSAGATQAIASTKIALNESAKTTAKKVIKVAATKPVKPVPVVAKAKVAPKVTKVVAKANVKPVAKSIARRDIYALQLASFSQLSNAQSLVNKLKAKGYKANYIRSPGRNGGVYKVYVGHSPRKLDVMKLKTQLASSMQLNGFVVNTGVS